jgi:hypothetical protein
MMQSKKCISRPNLTNIFRAVPIHYHRNNQKFVKNVTYFIPTNVHATFHEGEKERRKGKKGDRETHTQKQY